jgi:hypothetical protein
MWLRFGSGCKLPADVVAEIEASSLPTLEEIASGTTRGALADAISQLVPLAVAGIVGNAAWASLPATAAYLKALHQELRSAPNISAVEVSQIVRDAAREIVGPAAAVEIDALQELPDESWECQLTVAGDVVVAKVSRTGAVVAWRMIVLGR